jgi:hypothetical protein
VAGGGEDTLEVRYAEVKRPKDGGMTQAETVKLFGWREQHFNFSDPGKQRPR